MTLAGASAMARTAAALRSQEPDGTLHVGWLSDLVAKAADKVSVALELPRAEVKLPEPGA